jgi:hypothetical protein
MTRTLGGINGFTALTIYEPPEHPAAEARKRDATTLKDTARHILQYLLQRGFVRAQTTVRKQTVLCGLQNS